MTQFFKAMVTVGGLTAISRVAGFIRDILMARMLGAGLVADAFFVALKLPNFFRKVTAEGAFSVSFVPLYSEIFEKNGAERADQFASRTFTLMLIILSLFTGLCYILMPGIITVIAPGFRNDPERFELAVILSRITFPYLLLVSLTALLGGILNARDRFAPFAFIPVLYNLILIAALLLSTYFLNASYALAYGMLVAGFAQVGYMFWAARRNGVKLVFRAPFVSENMKRVLSRMGPGLIGAGVLQINLFADMIIASFLPQGSISYLYYADRLNQLPLGIIGIAVGTALLPMLSKAMSSGRMDEARALFNRALEFCLILGVPAAVALLVMPHVIVQILFEHGAFTSQDVRYTGYVLMGYALGLPAYIAIKVLSSSFWAVGDTKTPVKIAVISTACNIFLSLILIQNIGVVGIALATGLSSWLHFSLLKRRVPAGLSYDARLKRFFPRILLVALGMGTAIFTILNTWPAVFSDPMPVHLQVIALSLTILAAMTIYFGGLMALKVVNPKDLKQYLGRS